MHKYLAEFISEEELLRCEKTDSGTYLKSFALYKLVQIKLFCKLVLRFLQKFITFWRLESLNEASEIAHRLELHVYAKVFY